MEYIRKAEVYSNLIKLENIFPLEQRIIPGSLVFESRDPFSGYYSETPDSSPPVYLYLVLDKAYRFEEIMRATQKVRLSVPEEFDAAMGILNVGSEEPQFVIRLRNFRDIRVLIPIQEAYQEQGINFLKGHKKQGEYRVHTRIIKMLWLGEAAPFVYHDLKEQYHGYIEIPEFLPWEKFLTITRQVKYNWMGSKFDASCGSFVLDGELHEFVRIYSWNMDIGYLQDIRALYLEKMNRRVN